MIRRITQVRTIISTYTLVILIGWCSCLKIVGVVVPTVADVRQPVNLDCSYDTGKEKLFSVKWYKDSTEFFRYMPTHKPSVITFPFGGAILGDENDCDQKHCSIRLDKMTHDSSGEYTCEISTEAPFFLTAIETRNMTVMALPMEKPRIEGLRSVYTVGDILDIKCSTAPSSPPSLPSFYINDIEIDDKHVNRKVEPADANLFTSWGKLSLPLSREHFVGSLLRIRCSAAPASAPAITKTVDVTATLAVPQPLPNQMLEWPLKNSGHNQLFVCPLVISSAYFILQLIK